MFSNCNASTLLCLTHVAKVFKNLGFLRQPGGKFADVCVTERSLVEP